MAGRDPRCSVCRHERRDDVDALLLSGRRPADVFRDLTEALELSRAATFRHARAHLPVAIIGPRWVDGDSSTGDVILDLGALRRQLIEDRAAYRAQGNATASNSAAQRLESISLALLRDLGVSKESAESDAAALGILGVGLHALAPRFPDALRLMADALNGYDIRDDLRELRDSLAAELISLIPDPNQEM